MNRDVLMKPARSRLGRVLGRMAWWRRSLEGNPVTHLDAHTLRDIGLPEAETSRLRAEDELDSSRDRGRGIW
ncbi:MULTISPECIES: hypothetical protein [unclassified Achromobacter]|uniref:hypothetical protein n=1 Tax=unclassified Achromobacter TaxID=2626865 RepID=UPI00117827D8|nr:MULTISPECIES: hypothetical protein [unclassified Achromobacter]